MDPPSRMISSADIQYRLFILPGVEPGSYWPYGHIGNYPNGTVDEDRFDFQVVK